MKQNDIVVGETYLFVATDDPHRQHLVGKLFTVSDKKQVWKAQTVSRRVQVWRYLNLEGDQARAEELEPMVRSCHLCLEDAFCECAQCGKPMCAEHTCQKSVKDLTQDVFCTACTGKPTPAAREREFPCDVCDDGNMVQTGGGGPDGIFSYTCDRCGHQVSFP